MDDVIVRISGRNIHRGITLSSGGGRQSDDHTYKSNHGGIVPNTPAAGND